MYVCIYISIYIYIYEYVYIYIYVARLPTPKLNARVRNRASVAGP